MKGEGWSRSKCAGARSVEHGGREGAESLPHLDQGVDAVAHLRTPGVGQDRPRAERPGAELHAALEPADHLALGETVDGGFEQLLGPPPEVEGATGGRRQELRHLLGRVARTPGTCAPGGPGGGVRPSTARGRPPPRRGSLRRRWRRAARRDRENGPSRRILPFATQLRATPPAMHRFAAAGLGVEIAGFLEQDLLQDHLQAAGDVLVERQEVGLGGAWRNLRTARPGGPRTSGPAGESRSTPG